MPVVVIANPKGGVGKSTLATNVAGYYASQGHPVMLGDADRQQSARLWLGLRPPAARSIASWDVDNEQIVKPPKGTTHVVLDTPAGLHGRRLNEVMKLASKVIVPLQPSVFVLSPVCLTIGWAKSSRSLPAGVLSDSPTPIATRGFAELPTSFSPGNRPRFRAPNTDPASINTLDCMP